MPTAFPVPVPILPHYRSAALPSPAISVATRFAGVDSHQPDERVHRFQLTEEQAMVSVAVAGCSGSHLVMLVTPG